MRAVVFLLLMGCGGDTRVEKCHPDFGSVAGGDDIKVLGSGFGAGLSVKLGGRSARVVSVTSDTIEIQTPPHSATGPVDVEVVTSDGKALLKRSAFRYREQGQAPTQ